ncbi:MAG: LCP family protein [Bifidobacteriaceae bacterium]|nr:LCP family protein [Bifidobacteriaceae bacterium]
MSSRHIASGAEQPIRHLRNVRRHPVLKGLTLGILAVVLAVGTAAATAYIEFETALVSYDTDVLITNRPLPRAPTASVRDARDPFGGQAVNILLIGSDSREGTNQEIGGGNSGSMRSDSTLIVHISADRERIEAISIPRDTLVDIPSCKLSNGSTTAPMRHTKFNAAFSLGATQGANVGDAAACTIQTVESLTGIRIDGFVVVDFAGFVDVIDTLGHVRMCVDQDMRSSDAKLDIAAGCHEFDGTTALAYARARKGQGMPEGSDLARIDRQQELAASILDRAMELNLLTSMPELYRFATSAAKAVATSDNLGSATALAAFAVTLSDTPLDKVEFITAPNVDAGDRANVLFAADIQELWDAVAEDRHPVIASASSSPSGSPSSSAPGR